MTPEQIGTYKFIIAALLAGPFIIGLWALVIIIIVERIKEMK